MAFTGEKFTHFCLELLNYPTCNWFSENPPCKLYKYYDFWYLMSNPSYPLRKGHVFWLASKNPPPPNLAVWLIAPLTPQSRPIAPPDLSFKLKRVLTPKLLGKNTPWMFRLHSQFVLGCPWCLVNGL